MRVRIFRCVRDERFVDNRQSDTRAGREQVACAVALECLDLYRDLRVEVPRSAFNNSSNNDNNIL